MDKSTLSNYGWIVIAVLVLAVMIALATPFGKYIEGGVRATTKGLFGTSQNAMNTAFEDFGVQIDDQEFEEGYNFDADNSTENLPDKEIVNYGATFNGYYDDTMPVYSEEITLTWEELQEDENAIKYGYAFTLVEGNKITSSAFSNNIFIVNIIIPEGITHINEMSFTES